MKVEKRLEDVSMKIMDIIYNSDLCFSDVCGILENIKLVLFIQHLRDNKKELNNLWNAKNGDKDE